MVDSLLCTWLFLRVFFKEKRAFVHEVRCYKPLFVLIDTYRPYKAKHCLFGGKYSNDTCTLLYLFVESFTEIVCTYPVSVFFWKV